MSETNIEHAVLQWCRRQTAGYPKVNISDFTESWKDGLAITALVHSINQEFIDFHRVQPEDNEDTINDALDVLEQMFEFKHKITVLQMARGDHDRVFAFAREVRAHCGLEDLELARLSLAEMEKKNRPTRVTKENSETHVLSLLAKCLRDLDTLGTENRSTDSKEQRIGQLGTENRSTEEEHEVSDDERELTQQILEDSDSNESSVADLWSDVEHPSEEDKVREDEEDEENEDGLKSSEEPSEVYQRTDRNDVLRWCQTMTEDLPDVEIKDFCESWKNGVALNGLMHQIMPDMISAEFDVADVFESTGYLLDIVHQVLEIPEEISLEVMDVLSGEEEKIFNVVEYVYRKSVDDITDPESVEQTGNENTELEHEKGLRAASPDPYHAPVQQDIDKPEPVEDEREEPPLLENNNRTDNEPEGEIEQVEPPTFDCVLCLESSFISSSIKCMSFTSRESETSHRICLICLQGLAEALSTQGTLAPHGLGLPCVDPLCDQIFKWETVKPSLTSDQVRAMLDKRMDHEAVIVVLDTVECCTHCSFKVYMDDTIEEQQYFDCIECAAKFCRRCKVDYDKHAGLSCAEATHKNPEQEALDRLSAAIIRTCHKCHIQFTKVEGCNLMTCCCKATQCYCCRATDITYSHFCSHARIDEVCLDECGRVCILMDENNSSETAQLEKILKSLGRDP